MFIGHYAVGFAAARTSPGLTLPRAFIACQLLDLIWPVLVLLGLEHVSVDIGATKFTPLNFESYPWSHSLLMTVVWGFVWFGVSRRVGLPVRTAAVGAALVLSHWVLDFITHRPDLPLLVAGETKVGLGLWHSLPLTVAIEGLLFAGGVLLYLRRAPATDRTGVLATWGLVAFLVLIYLANAFGPKPEMGMSGKAIAAPALAMWLLVAWAAWIERHRRTRRA